jgi:hypothetical protein
MTPIGTQKAGSQGVKDHRFLLPDRPAPWKPVLAKLPPPLENDQTLNGPPRSNIAPLCNILDFREAKNTNFFKKKIPVIV